HTNTVGDQKMADVIFPVLASALGISTTPTPTPATPTPTPTPKPVTGVSISKTVAAMLVGKTLKLTGSVMPSDAANKAVVWTTTNAKIAIVSQSGLVTAKAAGTVTIKVSNSTGAFSKSCKITVTQPVTSVKLSKTKATLLKGKYLTLKATVSPITASNKKVTWKSSNTKVATVSSTGKVKGIKKGTATITVTTVDGKKTSKCVISVK
ncbi:MAG: Ig-like domain-containing protein, partial [Bacillota bacterium]